MRTLKTTGGIEFTTQDIIKGTEYFGPIAIKLATEVERMNDALEEVIKFNRLRNDLDAYLLAVSEWGIKGKWGADEEFTDRPDLTDFGVEQ